MPKVIEGPFLATNLPSVKDGTIKDGTIELFANIDLTRNLIDYTLTRISDFDPNIGPQSGIHTIVSISPIRLFQMIFMA